MDGRPLRTLLVLFKIPITVSHFCNIVTHFNLRVAHLMILFCVKYTGIIPEFLYVTT